VECWNVVYRSSEPPVPHHLGKTKRSIYDERTPKHTETHRSTPKHTEKYVKRLKHQKNIQSQSKMQNCFGNQKALWLSLLFYIFHIDFSRSLRFASYKPPAMSMGRSSIPAEYEALFRKFRIIFPHYFSKIHHDETIEFIDLMYCEYPRYITIEDSMTSH
jgi:hypothetical protein